MIGQRFGRLTVTGPAPDIKKSYRMWFCLCDCGVKKAISQNHLRRGSTKSCGCLSSTEMLRQRSTKHGKYGQPIWAVWASMKQRCSDMSVRSYASYGGRGITVCDRWLESFENFFEDMGDRPEGLQLDRIDNNKGYSKENCRWVTPSQNCRNRRDTLFITFNGATLSIMDWSDQIGVNTGTIRKRLKKGWDVGKVLFGARFGVRA